MKKTGDVQFCWLESADIRKPVPRWLSAAASQLKLPVPVPVAVARGVTLDVSTWASQKVCDTVVGMAGFP